MEICHNTAWHIYSIWILSVLYHVLTYFSSSGQYYHYTIYAIILIGVHHTAEPSTLSNCCHPQYIYQVDYFCLLIYYIAYLPTLRGKYCVFIINIQKCMCTISKLGILWFDLSHQYLYELPIFSFYEIQISLPYRKCFGYSPTPGQ